MTTVKTIWTDGLRFVSTTGSGHAVVTDTPPDVGGHNSAPSPVELVLAGLAACSAVDIVSILTRMKVALSSLEVTAEADRAEDHPRVFTRIRLHCVVTGDVPQKKLQRAIELSARTYCSVGAMLGQTAEIQHTHEIRS